MKVKFLCKNVELIRRDVLYLITLNAPDFDNASFHFDQFVIVDAIKDSASIRTIVALDVNTRGIRFREVDTFISLSAQGPGQKLVMVHFLSKSRNETG